MIWFFIILASIGLDRLVKWWSVVYLKPVSDIPVIPGVFHLTYAENLGAAFSMFSGARWVLIGVTSLGIAFVIYLLVKKPYQGRAFLTGLSLIVGGGLGNLIDRVWHGYVVDLFYIKLINFAVFNVADLCVTAGAVLVILSLLTTMNAEEKSHAKGR